MFVCLINTYQYENRPAFPLQDISLTVEDGLQTIGLDGQREASSNELSGMDCRTRNQI